MNELTRRGLGCAACLGIGGAAVAAAPATAAGRFVIATSAVPVGGGVIVSRRRVVVTQPRRGRFRVFSATCTHQGCAVSTVEDRLITCPCHGSQFKITDGTVARGPAQTRLPKKPFEIRDGRIYLT